MVLMMKMVVGDDGDDGNAVGMMTPNAMTRTMMEDDEQHS